MQIFHRSTNSISRVSLFGSLVLLAAATGTFALLDRSPYTTGEGVVLHQPIPFSHAHHVAGLGLDCRYCHDAVERSASAGIPPTETCMQCHSQVWSEAPMLEPVRSSLAEGTPLRWMRVHDLPDFAYFDHSVHVAAGVGCVTCHGRVDRMPLLRQTVSLKMEWCLDCHREPERFVRPPGQVFSMDWQPPDDRLAAGRAVVEDLGLRPRTSCSACHR